MTGDVDVLGPVQLPRRLEPRSLPRQAAARAVHRRRRAGAVGVRHLTAQACASSTCRCSPPRCCSISQPERGGLFVDCTVGLGGHARALLEAGATRVIGLDRDRDALALAPRDAGAVGRSRRARARRLPHARRRCSTRAAIARVDGALADLGVSSMQFDATGRGFSFQRDEPLDMRMDRSAGPTAADLVARATKRELADAILRLRRGALLAAHRARDRRGAARGADRDHRRSWPRSSAGRSRARGLQRIDPATRTFQALRIWVNRELDGLDRVSARRPRRLRRRRAAGGDHVSLARGPDREAHVARAGSSADGRRPGADEEADRAGRRRSDAQSARAQRQAARRGAGRSGLTRRSMMEAFEYAIKKDVRNNPIVREVDEARQRELWRSVGDRRACSWSRCCSRPGSTSSCCATATGSSRCSASARRKKRSTATCGCEIETLRVAAAHRAARDAAAAHGCAAPTTRSCIERVDAGRSAAASVVAAPLDESTDVMADARPPTPGAPTLAGAGSPSPASCPRALDRRHRGTARLPAGLSSTTISSRAPSASRCARLDVAGQARRHPRSATAACSPTASTPTSVYAVPTEIDDAAASGRARLCRALDDCVATSSQRCWPSGWSSSDGVRRTSRRQCRPEEARRVAALKLDGIGFIKESRRFYPNRELAAHVLGYVGLDNTGPGRHRAAYDSHDQRQAGQGPDSDRRPARTRSAAPSGRRPPAPPSSSRSTSTCSTSPSAS